MKSIRRYLRSRILCGASAILIAGSVLLGLAIRHLDTREFDAALETKARMLATLVLRDNRTIEVNFAGEYMPEFERRRNPEYFQLRMPSGQVIERSGMLEGHDLPFLPVTTGKAVFMNLRLPDGRRGRFLQLAFPPRMEGDRETMQDGTHFEIPGTVDRDSSFVLLGVARSREPLDALLLKVYLTLAGIVLFLVAVIAVVVQRSLNRGFRPIAEIDMQIRSLAPGAPGKRINMPDAPLELQTILVALNSFLEQHQEAFTRERRFTSDVAHELRTPVAEFRAACEVGAKWSDDPALVRRRFENLRDSAASMSSMVDQLLELSRADSGGASGLVLTDIQVAALVEASWSRILKHAEQTGTRLDNRIAPSVILHTDAAKLEMILQNLLCNGATYSPPDSSVICSANPSAGGELILRVSNRTTGLGQEDLEHLFERFWRKDQARTTDGHAGLGLSIVKALADAIGIRVDADLSPESILTVSLAFPVESRVQENPGRDHRV